MDLVRVQRVLGYRLAVSSERHERNQSAGCTSIGKTEVDSIPRRLLQQILARRGRPGWYSPRRYSLRERTSLTGCFALRSRFVLSAVVVPLCSVITVPRSGARPSPARVIPTRAGHRQEEEEEEEEEGGGRRGKTRGGRRKSLYNFLGLLRGLHRE